MPDAVLCFDVPADSDDDPDRPDDDQDGLEGLDDGIDDGLDDAPAGGLDYLAPAKAARMAGLPLYEFRRLVESGRGPAIARFVTGQGGWRVRRDVLQQWFDWQRFLDGWAREGQAA